MMYNEHVLASQVTFMGTMFLKDLLGRIAYWTFFGTMLFTDLVPVDAYAVPPGDVWRPIPKRNYRSVAQRTQRTQWTKWIHGVGVKTRITCAAAANSLK